MCVYIYIYIYTDLSMVQLLLSGILHRSSMFEPGPFRMEFVVNKMELEQVYQWEYRCSSFSIATVMRHTATIRFSLTPCN